MSNRNKKTLRELDVFDIVDNAPDTSASAIDAELFGGIQSVDANRQSANPVSIFDIFPDPRQPRRTVPHALKAYWSGNPQDTEKLFTAWIATIERERQTVFDLAAYLDADTDIENPNSERERKISPLEESFLTLIDLAVSIRKEGLTNPITVAPFGLKYTLETGERRWLAYHLLYIYTRDDKYAKIAARTVEKVNLWRQASENNARTNLNAISRARQFAVLLMDLLQEKRDDKFTPLAQFDAEQFYYAQVANGEQFTIPRNTSQRLLTAMGLKHPKQLRDYRSLLDLPNVVWQIADDLNWTEYFIRSLREMTSNDDELVRLAVLKASEAGYHFVTPLTTDDDSDEQSFNARRLDDGDQEPSAPGTKKYYTQFSRLLQKAGPGKGKVNREAMHMIQEFKVWIEEQERIVGRYLGE